MMSHASKLLMSVVLLPLAVPPRIAAQSGRSQTDNNPSVKDQTPDRRPQTGANPQPAAQREQANAALEAKDYAAAVKLLTPLAEANPRDAQILYDLGSAQDALDQETAAERSYRAAIAVDDKLIEPKVALGLLLARAGRMEEARTQLAAATEVTGGDKLLQARAYRAMARIDSKARPGQARDELLAALKLSPETPDDTLLSAELAAKAANGAEPAEEAYRRVLAQRPDDPAATAALAHLLVQSKRAAEAEDLLKATLAAHPGDVAVTAQLASTYAAEGKAGEAVPLVEALHREQPADAEISRLLASVYLAGNKDAEAEPLLAQLCARTPNDGMLADDHARALIHLKRFAEAQETLSRAVAQPSRFPSPSDLGNAAGDLAFAASENGDPEAALRALQLRATVLPVSAPVLFLTAISHDKLHHTRLAQQAYKQFLAASNGSNPDQEFEARHRLVALEHTK